jgi:hypothetical protein
MSNLSPDNSAETMMTNVSRMVETLGSVVNAIAKETATTNDTMKQMMIQQTATMNNFMMIMSRNKERRQEVPIREIHQTSIPTSTITYSQFSLSQQSTSASKRKIDGIADDKTTAVSTTLLGTDLSIEEDDIDAMLEEQLDAMEEIRTEQEEAMDVTMTDNAETTEPPQQKQQEVTTNGATTAMAAGDFEQQFNRNKKGNEQKGSNESLTSTRKVSKRTIDAQIRPAYKIANNANKTNKKVAEEKLKKEGGKDDKTNQVKIQEAEGTNTKEPKEKNAIQEKTKDETRKEEKTGAIST